MENGQKWIFLSSQHWIDSQKYWMWNYWHEFKTQDLYPQLLPIETWRYLKSAFLRGALTMPLEQMENPFFWLVVLHRQGDYLDSGYPSGNMEL